MNLESRSKSILWIFICTSIYLAVSLTYVFVADRDFWFDEAFTGATVRVMSEQKIDFAQYDVHPPGYYSLAYAWMGLKPSWVVDHMWLRCLSVLFGALFIVFLGLFAYSEFSNRTAVSRSLLLVVLGTTFLQYSTEARMYMVVMFLAVFACYAGSQSARYASMWWGMAGCVALILLPFIHYFSVIAVPFVITVWWIVFQDRGYVSWGPPLVAGILAGASALLAAAIYALPQKARVGGLMLHLDSFDVTAVVSGWFFAFSFIGDRITNVLMQLSALIMVTAGLAVVMWKMRKPDSSICEWRLGLVFISTSLIVPAGILFGTFVAYHHRYVLVVLWMLVFITFYTLFASVRFKDELFSGVMAVAIICMLFWAQIPDREVQNMFESMPCNSNIVVVHETTFSYMPALQYAHERNCSLNQVLATNMDERWLAGVGADALWLQNKTVWVNGSFNATNVPYLYVNVLNDTLGVKNASCVIWKSRGAEIELRWVDPRHNLTEGFCEINIE